MSYTILKRFKFLVLRFGQCFYLFTKYTVSYFYSSNIGLNLIDYIEFITLVTTKIILKLSYLFPITYFNGG